VARNYIRILLYFDVPRRIGVVLGYRTSDLGLHYWRKESHILNIDASVHETSNYKSGVICHLAPKITDEISSTVRKLELKVFSPVSTTVDVNDWRAYALPVAVYMPKHCRM
jgi:hypothetical protein